MRKWLSALLLLAILLCGCTQDTPEIREALRQKQKELHIEILNSRITTCDDNTLNLVLNVRMKAAIPFEAVVKFMDEHPEIKSLSV